MDPQIRCALADYKKRRAVDQEVSYEIGGGRQCGPRKAGRQPGVAGVHHKVAGGGGYVQNRGFRRAEFSQGEGGRS